MVFMVSKTSEKWKSRLIVVVTWLIIDYQWPIWENQTNNATLQVMLNNSNAGRIAPIGLEHAVLHGWKLAKDEAHQRASFLLMDINEITIINKLQIKKT